MHTCSHVQAPLLIILFSAPTSIKPSATTRLRSTRSCVRAAVRARRLYMSVRTTYPDCLRTYPHALPHCAVNIVVVVIAITVVTISVGITALYIAIMVLTFWNIRDLMVLVVLFLISHIFFCMVIDLEICALSFSSLKPVSTFIEMKLRLLVFSVV